MSESTIEEIFNIIFSPSSGDLQERKVLNVIFSPVTAVRLWRERIWQNLFTRLLF